MLYVPGYARMPTEGAIALARAHPFALVVSTAGETPFATHIPLLTEEDADGGSWLRGHVARANPHWRAWTANDPALAVFRGPHAYVSPRWYQNPEDVPTWNYQVAHAVGRPRAVEDAAWLAALLRRLADRFDPEWAARAPSPAGARNRAALMGGIVGFEMRVEEWLGKAKLGQNRSDADRSGAADGLDAAGSPDLAAAMRQAASRTA